MVELKLRKIGIESGGYFPVTAHRQESVDDPVRSAGIAAGHEKPGKEFDIPVIYPIHPRSRKRIQEFGINMNDSIRLMGPVDFPDSSKLECSARPVLTDSNGVQEESCILGVPCVTLRDDTEGHETVEVGANVLAGTGAGRIVECAREMSGRERTWENPFGDGMAGER